MSPQKMFGGERDRGWGKSYLLYTNRNFSYYVTRRSSQTCIHKYFDKEHVCKIPCLSIESGNPCTKGNFYTTFANNYGTDNTKY